MFTRNCPKCNTSMGYANRDSLAQANKVNVICINCKQDITKKAKIRYCPRCDNAIEYHTRHAMERGTKVNSVCSDCKKELCEMLKEAGKYRECPKCHKNIKYSNANAANKARKHESPCSECRVNDTLRSDGMSKCSKCKEIKEVTYFSKCSSKKNGIRSRCKKCTAQGIKDNPDNMNKSRKKWRDNNPDNNPDKIAAYSRKRRAMKQNVQENFSIAEWQITLSVFGNKCFNCSNDEITMDHHEPLSSGCALAVDNCVPLCMPCNSSKNDRPPDQFYSADQLQIIQKLFKKAIKLCKKIYGS